MVLSDRDLRKLLKVPPEVGLAPDFLERVGRGDIPAELDRALDDGWIIIEPMPPDEWFDADTVDLACGFVLEVPEVPLEVVRIDGSTVIRRYTIDFRYDRAPRRLEYLRKVSVEDQSRLRFTLGADEVFELQPGMMALVHTREVICVPYNLQMNIGGRSRLARSGITAHVSSTVFHAGWCGHPTMEMKNDGHFSFNLHPGLPVAAVSFTKLTSAAERPYLKKPWAKFSGQR